MIRLICDSCAIQIDKETANTVTIKNVFNKKVTLHYCHKCALKMFPHLHSLISWTAPIRKVQND